MQNQSLTEAMKVARRRYVEMYDFLGETLAGNGQFGRYRLNGNQGKTGRNKEDDCYLVRVMRNESAVLSTTFVAGGAVILSTRYGSWSFESDERGHFTCQCYAWVLLHQIILDSYSGRLAA